MILSLKTADATTQLQLIDASQPQKPLAQVEWQSGRELSSQLLQRILDMLAMHHQTPQDLTGVAVFSGPGSFTSLRIGHTVANALADGLAIPVVGAQGDDWLETALKQFASAVPGHPALPFYGAEAHITRPKH